MRKILCLISAIMLFACEEESKHQYNLVIRDHKFHPSKLEIVADKSVILIVKNEDATVEEFESIDLKREKIVPAHGAIKVHIGPLKPGVYKFFGEFHEKTAHGEIVVK